MPPAAIDRLQSKQLHQTITLTPSLPSLPLHPVQPQAPSVIYRSKRRLARALAPPRTSSGPAGDRRLFSIGSEGRHFCGVNSDARDRLGLCHRRRPRPCPLHSRPPLYIYAARGLPSGLLRMRKRGKRVRSLTCGVCVDLALLPSVLNPSSFCPLHVLCPRTYHRRHPLPRALPSPNQC